MFNYIALLTVAMVGIVFFDDDPTSVSIQEWVLFAIMIYAAGHLYRLFRELANDQDDN